LVTTSFDEPLVGAFDLMRFIVRKVP
jgi:hypothetical protein